MRRRSYNASCTLRWPNVQLDHLTLVPASLLSFKAQWQHLADELPAGAAVFVVSAEETSAKQAMRRVALALRVNGRQVAAIELSLDAA